MRESWLLNLLIPGEFWLPGVFCTCKLKKQTNLGRLPGVFPGDEYTGESRLPGGEYTRESRLLGSEYTGESITNTNNFLKIRKSSKSFLGMSNGKRRSCLMKKTRVKKSRDTVPLKGQ